MSSVATQQVYTRTPISSSQLVKIFDVLCSRLFDAEVILPDGTVKLVPDVRAYAARLNVMPNGFIELEVKAKDGGKGEIGSHTIKYPYHFTSGGVLCAIKRNMVWAKDSLALSYDFFSLAWETCIIIHEIDEVPFVFIATRSEWEKNGEVGESGCEVNMFLPIARFQRFSIPALKSIISPSFVGWIDDSLSACKHKRERQREKE